jgi:ceramide glucosyltransferase
MYCMDVFSLIPFASRKRYRLRPRSPLSSAPADSVPGVSILRPLRGLDANLFENLESTFTQEYPKSRFEVLLSVADEQDQALDVVRRLLEKHPDVDAKIIIGKFECDLSSSTLTHKAFCRRRDCWCKSQNQ